jgi:thioredoxin reductase
MFRRLPIFERLISWTKPDAPATRGTREYELYDHNSLVADEPHAQAICAALMDRSYDVPSRPEMEAALTQYVERTRVRVRYGCRWTGTRREDDGFVLETTDGEYRCRVAIFALGVTTPWKAPITGLEHASHYVEVLSPAAYADKRVFIVGKRNSAFEVANGILPWARQIVLASPRPIKTESLGHLALRTRYMQPYDEHVRGGFGTSVLDAAVDRIDRTGDGFRVTVHPTGWPGTLEVEVDEVIAATGFQVPLGDLLDLGVATVADGRIPALTPFWESVSVPGLYFAGNTTQGSRGLRKQGLASNSSSVNGYRYNALVLARHVAEQHFGVEPPRPRIDEGELVPLLLRELDGAPELWIQKGYLCRIVNRTDDGLRDDGILPLQTFVDEPGPDAVAVAIEMEAGGTIYPSVYVRIRNEVHEHPLPTHPLHDYTGGEHEEIVRSLVGPLLRSAQWSRAATRFSGR